MANPNSNSTVMKYSITSILTAFAVRPLLHLRVDLRLQAGDVAVPERDHCGGAAALGALAGFAFGVGFLLAGAEHLTRVACAQNPSRMAEGARQRSAEAVIAGQ